MSQERPFGERGAFVSERGLRPVNQDAVLMAELPGDAELIAVADGMGGQAAGEIASHRALDVLHTALRDGADLRSAMQSANTAVLAEARDRPECAGMGTTVVAVLRRGVSYTIANVGDSRAYRIDAVSIRQLTQDHSFIAEAGQAGGLSLQEAERSPWRNAVTRALGTAPDLEVDCFGPHDTRDPHTLLLCTDGLYRVVPDEQLLGAVVAAADPSDAVSTLARAAYEAGSDDNISLAIVEFGGGASAADHERGAAGEAGNRGTAGAGAGADARRAEGIAHGLPDSTPGSTGDRPPRPDRPGTAYRGGRKTARRDWKFTLDYVMFTIILILVIYMAVAGLMGP